MKVLWRGETLDVPAEYAARMIEHGAVKAEEDTSSGAGAPPSPTGEGMDEGKAEKAIPHPSAAPTPSPTGEGLDTEEPSSTQGEGEKTSSGACAPPSPTGEGMDEGKVEEEISAPAKGKTRKVKK